MRNSSKLYLKSSTQKATNIYKIWLIAYTQEDLHYETHSNGWNVQFYVSIYWITGSQGMSLASAIVLLLTPAN